MPKDLQDKITIEISFPVRQKQNGVYEVRYRAHGFNVAASSVDFDKLKPKFITALRNSARQEQETFPERYPKQQGAPRFVDVAERWLELRKPTIKPTTCEHYESLFGANIFPVFIGRKIDDLKQSDCLALINAYVEQGKNRTATKIYQTLKAVFEFAVGDELIERSPMRLIKPPKYEEQTGVALTLKEECEFIGLLNASKCAPEIKSALIFLLYTGIRRSELSGALIENGFVSVVCSKMRKGYREKRRLIPITPMLAQWLPQINVVQIVSVRPDALTQAMKRLMPKHHLHELRHTFITRCQECGVPREVVSVWAGHAADNTQTSNVYTHFSPEFMQEQAQKVQYII